MNDNNEKKGEQSEEDDDGKKFISESLCNWHRENKLASKLSVTSLSLKKTFLTDVKN